MLTKKVFSSMILLALILAASPKTNAQLGTAGITGMVSDSNGAAIAQARVIVVNRSTGQSRAVMTNGSGIYAIQSLLPATYDVKFQAAGFAEFIISNLAVRVGAVAAINATLKPAGASETLEVNAREMRGVDVTTSQVTGFITDRFVTNLPLNGRNFLDLAFLLPGNSPAPNF